MGRGTGIRSRAPIGAPVAIAIVAFALTAASCSSLVGPVGESVAGGGSDSAIVRTEAGATTSAPATTLEPPSSTAPSTQPPSTEAPTTTVPVREPVVIGIAGDSTFTNGLEQRDPFGQITELLSAPDLMIINLETAVADASVGRPPVDKAFLFKSPPASLDLLVDAGIDAVTLGNNHALDFGIDALEQTLDEIDARGILRTGAGRNEAEAYEPLIVDVGEWTIGVVSFSRVPCDWSASGVNSREQVAWACPPFMELADGAVLAALDEADVVIVAVHGGEEGVLCPSPFMVELEQHWAELGAHAVVDGHPHVLQGVTMHGDTVTAHSTGNFAFPPARGISGNSAIVELVVSEGANLESPVVTMRIVPVRSDGGVLSVPSDGQRTEIIEQMNRVSSGALVGNDGVVTVEPDHTGTC